MTWNLIVLNAIYNHIQILFLFLISQIYLLSERPGICLFVCFHKRQNG